MRRKRVRHSVGLCVVAALLFAACGPNSDADLETAVVTLDADLTETRNELEAERQRADGLERELADTNARLAELQTPSTTSTTTSVLPDPDVTTPADDEPIEDPLAIGPEADFRRVVADNPTEFASTRCESDDIDCVVEAALTLCEGWNNADTVALVRLSPYSPSRDDDRALIDAAIEFFCPTQVVGVIWPPIILTEGVFAAVEEGATPPTEIPSGTYTTVVDRTTECFWERKDESGEVIAEALVPAVTRVVTLAVPVEGGETFTTFGCRHWIHEA